MGYDSNPFLQMMWHADYVAEALRENMAGREEHYLQV